MLNGETYVLYRLQIQFKVIHDHLNNTAIRMVMSNKSVHNNKKSNSKVFILYHFILIYCLYHQQ